MLEQGNHPDIMIVEKDTKVIKIDTIRNNIIQFMHIKPYQSNYKIVIVKSADSITTEGQNALLLFNLSATDCVNQSWRETSRERFYWL